MLLACGMFILLPFATGVFHQSGSGLLSNISSISSALGISRFLRDGEFERVTTWPGFCAKETSIGWGEIDVTLREVWLKEEKRKLQLIYEGGTLSDCFEARIEPAAADEGGGDVTGECLSRLKPMALRKNEVEDQDDESGAGILTQENYSPQNIADWFVSVDELRDQCFRVRTRTRNQVVARQGQSRVRRGFLTEFLFAPGTKWCGPTQLASNYNELGAFDQLDRCCRRHDHCQRAIPPMTQRYALHNHMPFTLSHCGCDQRRGYEVRQIGGVDESKRKRRRERGRGRGRGRGRERERERERRRGRGKRDLLLIPGTQWCGRGHRATKYTNLGGFGDTDACCRRHDTTCPFFIPAFHTKYNLFNWGVSTLMHCTCDERFRTCLKMAGTSSANFVGKLFFNVVQTKCFVLKLQKSCLRRSWWGTCELHEYRKQAHLRDNVPY